LRFSDILAIAVSALVQQKVRTLLTTAGVVIGTFLLVVCISIGLGFEQEVMRQLSRGSLTRQIMVWPGSGVRESEIPEEKLVVRGAMSAAKRQRIRQAIIHRWPIRRGRQLNQERVRALKQIPHVQEVTPLVEATCQVLLVDEKQEALGPALAAGLAGLAGTPGGSVPAAAALDTVRLPRTVTCFAANADNQHFHNRLVAGEFLTSDAGYRVVVSEYLLYLWGITGDEAVASALGKKLRVEYRLGGQSPRSLLALIQRSGLNLAPEVRKALEKAVREAATAAGAPGRVVFAADFTIVGVVREFMEDRDSTDVFDLGAGESSRSADVFLPSRTAAEMVARDPRHAAFGFPGVIVTVDREENIKAVSKGVQSQGLHSFSLAEVVKVLRANLALATFLAAFLAGVALQVAGLGITNTMIMAVLERTREIGIMKAVGARDGHIRLMFLVEGALIGLLGGTLGVLFSWLASFAGNSIVRSLLQDPNFPPLQNTLFLFPLWLTLGAPLGAGLLTTLAAVYPAWRATKVNPITALRHE
jgi:putative ABC transport system permease protein